MTDTSDRDELVRLAGEQAKLLKTPPQQCPQLSTPATALRAPPEGLDSLHHEEIAFHR